MYNKGFISKLRMLGVGSQYSRILEDIPFKIYSSRYNVLHKDRLNIKWYIDQLKQYTQDKGCLCSTEINKYSYIEQGVKLSTLNGKPVWQLVNETVWEMLEYMLKIYEAMEHNDFAGIGVFNSSIVSAAKYVTGIKHGIDIYNMYKLEELRYKLLSQVLSIIIIADNNWEYGSLNFYGSSMIINGAFVCQDKYDVIVNNYGAVNVQSRQVEEVGYNINKLVFRCKGGYQEFSRVNIEYGYNNISEMEIREGEKCVVTHMVLKPVEYDNMEFILLDNTHSLNEPIYRLCDLIMCME